MAPKANHARKAKRAAQAKAACELIDSKEIDQLPNVLRGLIFDYTIDSSYISMAIAGRRFEDLEWLHKSYPALRLPHGSCKTSRHHRSDLHALGQQDRKLAELLVDCIDKSAVVPQRHPPPQGLKWHYTYIDMYAARDWWHFTNECDLKVSQLLDKAEVNRELRAKVKKVE